MKVDYRIILISLFCGIFFWVASAVLEYLYYGDQYSFHDLLIKGLPYYESYLRSAIFAFFMLFGLLMSRAVVKIRQANLTLKESQEKLQAQNELLNRIMESLTHPFYVVDVNDYSISMANPAAYRNGISTRHTCYEIVHQYSVPCSEIGEFCPIEEVKKTKIPMVFEHVNYDTNGNPRNIEIHAYPIFDNQGNVIQLIEYCIDITERRQTEKSLESERKRLAVTLRSIGDGVIVTNIEGRIALINRSAEELTGWTEEDALDKKISEVFCITNKEQCENPVEKVLRTGIGIGFSGDMVLLTKDKAERIISDSSSPVRDKDGNTIGVVIVFRDITENRRIESELQRIDKLESISILTGGIAHDFNNILTSIMGNLSLAMIHSDPGKIKKRMMDAERSCLKARDLTKQLLIFSKGGTPIKKTGLISDFIKESVMFALRGSNTRAEFQIPNDLLSVNVDEELINQVINNLVINADQAMPEGGKIKVYAENLILDDESILPLKAGRYVRISIEDHGVGISKENLQRIFDPYFTTKKKGQGLGLTESYFIVRKHEGYITVESTVGVGTTFHIYLPVSLDTVPTVKIETDEYPIKGNGRILVMDDEKYIRDTIAEMLSNIGYKVTTAVDGFEAIQLYFEAKTEGQPYDAVIFDLIVPGSMGGEEAIKKIKKIDPEVKAIVSSAYSSDPIMANFKNYGFDGVLPKPYRVSELSKAVNQVIKEQR